MLLCAVLSAELRAAAALQDGAVQTVALMSVVMLDAVMLGAVLTALAGGSKDKHSGGMEGSLLCRRPVLAPAGLNTAINNALLSTARARGATLSEACRCRLP